MLSRPRGFLRRARGGGGAGGGGPCGPPRHNLTDAVVAPPAAAATSSAPVSPAASTQSSSQPVAETEATVTGKKVEALAPLRAEKADPARASAPRRAGPVSPKPVSPSHPGNEPAVARTVPMTGAAQPQFEPQIAPVQPALDAAPVTPGSPKPASDGAKPVDPQPEPPRAPAPRRSGGGGWRAPPPAAFLAVAGGPRSAAPRGRRADRRPSWAASAPW